MNRHGKLVKTRNERKPEVQKHPYATPRVKRFGSLADLVAANVGIGVDGGVDSSGN